MGLLLWRFLLCFLRLSPNYVQPVNNCPTQMTLKVETLVIAKIYSKCMQLTEI